MMIRIMDKMRNQSIEKLHDLYLKVAICLFRRKMKIKSGKKVFPRLW